MEAAVITHVGLIREINEDRAGVFRREDGPMLAAVADGMGGHQAGSGQPNGLKHFGRAV